MYYGAEIWGTDVCRKIQSVLFSRCQKERLKIPISQPVGTWEGVQHSQTKTRSFKTLFYIQDENDKRLIKIYICGQVQLNGSGSKELSILYIKM